MNKHHIVCSIICSVNHLLMEHTLYIAVNYIVITVSALNNKFCGQESQDRLPCNYYM